MNETLKRCKVFNPFRQQWLLVLVLYSPAALLAEAAEADPVREAEALVQKVEAETGPFDAALVEPLLKLAGIYQSLSDAELAEDTLRRAQNILHRQEGVYTNSQINILNRLTDLEISLGEFEAANLQQEFIHRVRTDTEDTGELVAADLALADWYTATGQPHRARNLLEDTLERVEPRTTQELTVLMKINAARRLQESCCRTSDLEDAVEKPSAFSRDLLTDVYLELADSMTLRGKEKQAAIFYQQAHALAPDQVDGEPAPISARHRLRHSLDRNSRTYRFSRDDPFFERRLKPMTHNEMMEDESREPQWFLIDGEDQLKVFNLPDTHETFDREKRTQTMAGRPLLFNEDQLTNLLRYRFTNRTETLTIELSFTVTETGNLRDITVLESNGPARLNRLVREALGRVHFRPALEDGRPVARENVRLTQVFEAPDQADDQAERNGEEKN